MKVHMEMFDRILKQADEALGDDRALNAECVQHIFDVMMMIVEVYRGSRHTDEYRETICVCVALMHAFISKHGGSVIFRDTTAVIDPIQ